MAIAPPDSNRLSQTTFVGGMNAFGAATEIADNEYWYLSNGRVRASDVAPIKKAVKIITPAGAKYQGMEVVDKYLVLFVDGKAYYKDLSVNGNFNQIAAFQLDPVAEQLYSCLVPGTTAKDVRTASDPSSPVVLKSNTSGTPGCLIVQDGTSIPLLIDQGANTRQLQTYDLWNLDSREYVPIGRQMIWSGDILFIMSHDRRSIFRSVTGRPLDFVVAIDNDGNKLADENGTEITSDYNELTSLIPLSGSGDVVIAASSLNSTRMLIGDLTNTLYGEPTFSKPPLFTTGALNEFSYTDILGDTVFIDQSGIRSFNATRQQKVASNANIFSIRISSLLEGVTQDITACGSFQNYEFFAMKSIYGYGIFVYDSHLQRFVAFDRWSGVGAIKKFCTTKINGSYRLFVLTNDNEVFEAFASSEYETCTFYGKETTSDDIKRLRYPIYARVQLDYTPQAGTVLADVLVDKRLVRGYSLPVTPTENTLNYPLDNSVNQANESLNWVFDKAREGLTLGLRLVWNTGSPISAMSLEYNERNYYVPATKR